LIILHKSAKNFTSNCRCNTDTVLSLFTVIRAALVNGAMVDVQVHEVFVSVRMREVEAEHARRAAVRRRRKPSRRSTSELRRCSGHGARRLLAAAAASAVRPDDSWPDARPTSAGRAVHDARLGGHDTAAHRGRTERRGAGGGRRRSTYERPRSRSSR